MKAARRGGFVPFVASVREKDAAKMGETGYSVLWYALSGRISCINVRL